MMKAIFILIITVSTLLSYAQTTEIASWQYQSAVAARDSFAAISQRIDGLTPGGQETDPVWTSEKSGYATLPITVPPESDPVWLLQKSGYATLPLPSESDPVWTAAALGYATTTALTNGLSGKADVSHTQAISTITNLQTSLDAKQATLVSGTNIKTINSQSLLGSGDIVISGSGNGYALHFFCLTSSMASATTYYMGDIPFALTTTQNLCRVYPPKAGTIKSAKIYFRRTNGTYTSGNLVVSVNKNNVATQIATAANFTTAQVFSNESLSIAVVTTDILEIKITSPTLSVAGTACFFSGTLYIE
jgi:hemin uptake protein HemP